jgi:hypothetical protein
MTTFGFRGVAGLKTPLLFALADEFAQVLWHSFSEVVDTAAWMFPGT